MPNLKLLDKIPVIHTNKNQKEASKNRKQIVEAAEKFIQKIRAPKSRESSLDAKISFVSQNQPKNSEEQKKHTSDLASLYNQSRTESKPNRKEVQSLNYSLATAHKAPLINLDAGLKNDNTGIFTFMYEKGIESTAPVAKDSLKEIINIQEEYINKKSKTLVPDLTK